MAKNKLRILLIVLILLALIAGVALMVVSHQAKPPVLVSRTDPPHISFSEEEHQLGEVQEGVEIPFSFKIHNDGGEPLIIKEVTSSCSCALVSLTEKYIEAGKTGDLGVILDTTGLKGELREEIKIFSNDPEQKQVSVYLLAKVLPKDEEAAKKKSLRRPSSRAEQSNIITLVDPHANLTDAGRGEIFRGDCATCHALQGKGKLGGDLFQADCAMCHGQNAEGGLGPSLVTGNYHDPEFVRHVQEVIQAGSLNSKSMPAFAKEKGGPLTETEIVSILNFLQTKSEQVREAQGVKPGG